MRRRRPGSRFRFRSARCVSSRIPHPGLRRAWRPRARPVLAATLTTSTASLRPASTTGPSSRKSVCRRLGGPHPGADSRHHIRHEQQRCPRWEELGAGAHPLRGGTPHLRVLPRFWASFDATYYTGGRTSLNGREEGPELCLRLQGPITTGYVVAVILAGTTAGPPPPKGVHVAYAQVRKTRAKEYSTIAGFFRQYELIYVVADERDVIRVPTNYRKSPPEDVYMFRAVAPVENARRAAVGSRRLVRRRAGSLALPARPSRTLPATAPGSPRSRRTPEPNRPAARPAAGAESSPSCGAPKSAPAPARYQQRRPTPARSRRPSGLACVCSWPPPRGSIMPPSEVCSENQPLGCRSGCRLEDDPIALMLQSLDGAAARALAGALIEVVDAELLITRAVDQHVIGNHQDGASHGHDGLSVAAVAHDTTIARRKRRIGGSGRGLRRFNEGGAKPAV